MNNILTLTYWVLGLGKLWGPLLSLPYCLNQISHPRDWIKWKWKVRSLCKVLELESWPSGEIFTTTFCCSKPYGSSASPGLALSQVILSLSSRSLLTPWLHYVFLSAKSDPTHPPQFSSRPGFYKEFPFIFFSIETINPVHLLTWHFTSSVSLQPAFGGSKASLVAQTVKRLPAVQETWVQSLGCEDPLEKEMATHSSTLAWKIPWTEEPGRLQSTWSQNRTRLSDFRFSFNFIMEDWLSPERGHFNCHFEVRKRKSSGLFCV